jgi:hypothetical protein
MRRPRKQAALVSRHSIQRVGLVHHRLRKEVIGGQQLENFVGEILDGEVIDRVDEYHVRVLDQRLRYQERFRTEERLLAFGL